MSWDAPEPRARARLICDSADCKNEVAGYGVTMDEANTDLITNARAAGWLADGLDGTIREAQRILGERFTKMKVVDLPEFGRQTVHVPRRDLCPTCAAARSPQPPEAA